ncbi:MAG: sulfotransferase [Planctomycetota bacterium]
MPPPTAAKLLQDIQEASANGQPAEALKICKKFLSSHRAHPRAVRVRQRAGQLCLALNDVPQAVAMFEHASRQAPRDGQGWIMLAGAQLRSGDGASAIVSYDEAIGLDAANAEAIAGKALVMAQLGDRASALELVEDAAARLDGWQLDHACAEIAGSGEPAARGVDRIRARLEAGDIPEHGRVMLLYALARLLEKQGDYGGSWDAATQANALQRRPFDTEAYAGELEAVCAAWTPDRLAALDPSAAGLDPVDGVVLVAGMPRSGTTLVDLVLAAHPDAGTAGEPGAMRDALGGTGLTNVQASERLGSIGSSKRRRVRDAYLQTVRGLAGGARVAIDKRPGNDEYGGVLSGLLPGAKLILMRRDPRDVAISCYMRNFAMGFAWCTDLGRIARVMAARLSLHQHWLDVLPDAAPWVSVTAAGYEDLVADPGTHARRLVAFAGLDWDDRCLDFAGRSGFRPTLEPDQGRGVYAGSVGRWEQFAPHMGDTLDVLAELTDRSGG